MKPDLFDRRPLVVILVLVVLFFWRLSLSPQYTFVDNPDLAYQVLPWYEVQAQAWNQGVFPMWDPYHWAGQSLLGQMQPGGAFPLNWALFLAPLENGHIDLLWIHWHFVLMHVLAALFMYGLVRELGRSRYASVLAGVAFGCGGYVAATGWPQKVNGAIWIPLIFLLFHRMAGAQDGFGRWTNALYCGGAIGMSLLSGHHQNPMYILLALTGLFLYFLLEQIRTSYREAAKFAGLYALTAGAAFVVAALQLLPALEYGAEAYRWVGMDEPVTMGQDVPYHLQTNLRLIAVTLLGMIVPQAHLHVSTFVGFVCLSLAIYAVCVCWAERWVRVYSCLSLGALAYSVGPFSLLHGWVYTAVPFVDKARATAHAVFVFQFALFILAAYGVDRLLTVGTDDQPAGPWLAYIQRTLAGFGVVCWLLILGHHIEESMNKNSGDTMMIASVTAFVLAALLAAACRGSLSPPGLRVALVALVVFELGVAHSSVLTHRTAPDRPGFLDQLEEFSGIAGFLNMQPKPFRFEIRSDAVKPNIGGWEGLEMVDGYLASISRNLFDFVSKDWVNRRLMLNMVYTVAKGKVRDAEVEVFSDPSGWKVFRNPDAYPRAWTVDDAAVISGDGDESLPRPETCQGDAAVAFEQQSLHRVSARVQMPCAGFLVFADPYFPGWQSRLDGQPTTLFRAHTALRAVFVGGGEHEVEFVYRPASVYLGGALTAIGLLSCLVVGLVSRRRRETTRS